MNRLLALAAVPVAAVLVGGDVAAQETPVIKVTRLTERLFQLTTDQGSYTTNTIASVGEDGVLLVDTQARENAVELKRVVDGFGRGAPKIIINTHRHVEHVGGNEIFGDGPIVIAHELVRTKLRSGSYLFDEFPDATLPDITLTDRVSVYFNGEAIRIIALPGSHDDNEVIVHFTDSKVVHLSSLVNGFNFPSVDSDGDVLKFAELVQRAIDVLPQDVVIVSGHNQNGSWRDLHAYRDMLIDTTEVVRRGLAAGKDAETLKAERVLDDWESYAGSYVSADGWIDSLVAGIEGTERKKSIFEPLYRAMQTGGADAAVALYLELKRNRADDYEFGEADLLLIGDKLLDRGQTRSALQFLELSLAEYPDSDYGYYVNYDLALAHDQLGDRDAAIRHCERALELSPENESVARLLESLTAAE